MSLENYSKVFFGPFAKPEPVEVKPSLGFFRPKEPSSKKPDSYSGSHDGLKHLHSGKGTKWQPKHLAKPSFLVDQVTTGGKANSQYEAAKTKYAKAQAEAEAAQREYEKAENSVKAAKAIGSPKAKIYAGQAAVAKQKYQQKLLAVQVAKKQMDAQGAKLAKPAKPDNSLAPCGEELTGPNSNTLAKNHSFAGTKKAIA